MYSSAGKGGTSTFAAKRDRARGNSELDRCSLGSVRRGAGELDHVPSHRGSFRDVFAEVGRGEPKCRAGQVSELRLYLSVSGSIETGWV
jgi:hypothetical protein